MGHSLSGDAYFERRCCAVGGLRASDRLLTTLALCDREQDITRINVSHWYCRTVHSMNFRHLVFECRVVQACYRESIVNLPVHTVVF